MVYLFLPDYHAVTIMSEIQVARPDQGTWRIQGGCHVKRIHGDRQDGKKHGHVPHLR